LVIAGIAALRPGFTGEWSGFAVREGFQEGGVDGGKDGDARAEAERED
jgi:hypothetical protein